MRCAPPRALVRRLRNSRNAGRAFSLTPDRIADFWSRARRDGDYLIWRRGTTSKGYGAFRVQGRELPAHRVAYMVSRGPIPHGLIVRHSCDRPACIAPAHLQLGTQKDNMRDKYERGRARHARGSALSNRLVEAQVLKLRHMRADGVSPSDIAARLGTTASQVIAIAAGRLWKHVGGPLTAPNPSDVQLAGIARGMSRRTGTRTARAVALIDSTGCSVCEAARNAGVSHQAVSAALRARSARRSVGASP